MKKSAGLTLIELMAAIAIFGILAGVAGYYYLGGLPNRRVLSESRELYRAIQNARSEAVNRGEDVTITFDLANDSFTPSTTSGPIPFPDYIDLYKASGGGGDNSYTFTPRGLLDGDTGRVKIKYHRPGPIEMGVLITKAGGISLIDETDDSWS